eukprot:1603155-Prymnesium_polylepis.2
MCDHLGRGVRSFTLIPLDALQTAIEMYGRDERSEALVGALGLERPESWDSEVGEEGEEEEEEEDEEGGEEDEGEEEGAENGEEDGEDNGEDDVPDDVSIEVAEHQTISDDSDDSVVQQGTPGPTSITSNSSCGGNTAKRLHVALDITPALDAELCAFDVHRTAVLNHDRKGMAVAPATRKTDRERVLRFMAWLTANYQFKSSPTLGIFAHPKVGAAAQRYIKELVETHGRKYSYGAKMAASLVAVAGFVSVRRGGSPDGGVVVELSALHLQCRQQARQDDKFDQA